MNRSLPRRGVAIPLFLALSIGVAHAQYVWMDEKGVKQYSDQPPPSSTPTGRILKTPSSKNASTFTAEAASSPGTPQPSLVEKNADFLKRRADQTEKEKKAAEDAKLSMSKAQNCERARDYQRLLDSGQRIAVMNKNGERAYLSDEERAREAQETRRILDTCQ